MLPAIRKQSAALALTFMVSALAFTARADERMSQSQTALGLTTIGGFVQSDFAFHPLQDIFRNTRSKLFLEQRQLEFPRLQNAESPSLTPLPPPSLDENALFQSSSFVLMLVDSPVQPVLLPSAANPSTTDAGMLEAIRADEVTRSLQLLIAPPPDFQIQLNQAGIQPVPEPSIFALVSLIVGLTALRRLKLACFSHENQ